MGTISIIKEKKYTEHIPRPAFIAPLPGFCHVEELKEKLEGNLFHPSFSKRSKSKDIDNDAFEDECEKLF